MNSTKLIVRELGLFTVLVCIPFFCFGIEINSYNTDSVKRLISKFQLENDLIAANRILNQNTGLGVEYTFSVLNKNLQIAKKSQQFEALAYTYLSLGNFWFMRGNKVKAYENYRESEMISRKYKFSKIIGLALMNASNVSSNMQKRIAQLKNAVIYFTISNDQLNLAKAYLNIGSCYSSYVLGTKVLSVSLPADTVSQEVLSEQEIKQFRDSAFHYYYQAKSLNDSLLHPEISASYNLRYAQWLKFEKNYTVAEFHFRSSLAFFNSANLFKGTVYNMLELADLAMLQKNYKQALQLADSTLDMAEKHGFTDYYSDACLLISEIYEKLGNDNEAIKYYKLYHNSLQLNNASLKDEKISALNLEFTIKEQENTIKLLLQQSKINRLIIFTVLLFASFIIVVGYFYWQNRKRKINYITESLKKAEELNAMQIELLNTQLENKQLHAQLLEEKVNSRSENLVQVANKIQKLEGYYDNLSEEIRQLAQKLASQSRGDELKPIKLSLMHIAQEQRELLELSTLSSQINQDFFFYIEKNYPKLTKEDKNLLAMLIIDLSSKQIADFLNISPDSVFKKRYRLRKKLNITNDTSFADFYKEIIKKNSSS